MKINIIGAGIGGLTAAISLRKKGHEVELFEAAENLRPIGAGIIMASNAMQIARRLGFADDIVQNGNVLQTFGVANHLEQALQIMDIEAIKAKFGEPSVAIHRGVLQQILLTHLQAIPLHLHKRLKDIEQSSTGKVIATFEDGSRAESDLLIGADGLRSATRKAIFGEKPLRYSSHTCWRGILQHQLPEAQRGLELWAKTGGKRIAMIQLAPNQVYFYYTEKRKPGFKIPKEMQLTYLQDQLHEFPAWYAELIGKVNPDDIFHDDLYDLKHLPTWHQGNVLLLGDAAHATTPNMGQGGCQAIEDAWYLAEYLEQYPKLADALAAYEKFRRPKVNFVVNTSFMLGRVSNMGGALGYRLRNWMMTLTPERMAEQQLERLFRLS